ncbi:MAG TPA: tetratricopeptide repeat protein [Cyclobacteriaceae bacterium]|nr:tetratricopeptide repeat protein [Cyclobacteriaceae bacterium]
MSFLALGNSDSAVNDFSEAIDHREVLDNTAARYYLYRAVARTNRRDYSNAEKDFTEAIHLNPSEPEIYFESSRLKFLTMGDKQAAITDLDWAVQLNPRKPEYYHKRAEYKAYQVKHNHFPRSILESAIRDVTFAISLDPGRYDYIEFRATLYKEVGDPMLAIEDYTLMIGMKPGDHTPYSERGIIRMQYDDYPNAIDDFTQAIGKDPEDEKNYRYRALCKYNSSDYRGAYADYSSAIMLLNKKYKNMPDEKTIRRILADTYIKRGVSATMLGNNFNACMDFSNANDLGSSKGYNYMRKYCGF